MPLSPKRHLPLPRQGVASPGRLGPPPCVPAGATPLMMGGPDAVHRA